MKSEVEAKWGCQSEGKGREEEGLRVGEKEVEKAKGKEEIR